MKKICQNAGKRCLGMHIRKAARLLAAHYDNYLRPADMKGTQFTLLNEIYLNPSITIGLLAERLSIDRTTLNRSLNLLQQKEFVMSKPGEDLRLRSLELTPKGKQSLQKALPLWQLAQSEVEKLFGRHLYKLTDDLRKLENLKR